MESENKKSRTQRSNRQSAAGTGDKQLPGGQAEARLAGRILFVASFITNFFPTDPLLVAASVGNLGAIILLNKAAFLEANAQQIAPGQTTFANRLKIAGSTLSMGVSFLLLWALIIEVFIKQRTAVSGQATAAGATGAFITRAVPE